MKAARWQRRPPAPGRRRWLAATLPALLLVPAAAWSAAPAYPPRIGWLKIQGPRHTPGQLIAFRQGLNSLGRIEGRDFAIDERYADGDAARLPGLVADLLAEGVSLIVATSQPSIAAAALMSKTVPIIGRMVDDPVAGGLARSLARPGGNVTGIYTLTEALNPKRLALLAEVVPTMRRVGVLLRADFPNPAVAAHDWQVAVAAARDLGLDLLALDARSAADIGAAFDQASATHVDGMMTFRTPTVVTYLELIADQCRRHRLPAVFDAREYVEAGGLMSYGPDIDAVYLRLADYADRLLHGAMPSDLPIEQPKTFELVVNERTAQALGIALAPSLLARADKLIR